MDEGAGGDGDAWTLGVLATEAAGMGVSGGVTGAGGTVGVAGSGFGEMMMAASGLGMV